MKTLDMVATLRKYAEQHIGKGQVGTVVEQLDGDHVLVEFANLDGIAYAILPISAEHLIQLKHTPTIPSA